ncbi:GNAT family N-acetyltransferase [Pseudoxanthomonas sp. OG2]|uniref:GNAT family N-acetyltransferase n=1 Tax=Pseudoxanthomonas sp. OG2 TaxID=2587011 RepID=UPI00160ABC46|nr:GNAT family N-acetyltransferase [Pseudoxanthomonas sp. OG2]MBB3277367.1 RimJ/RimL family protein N-acetyltransferase [Pseudoxanthomonas sp. OG2]
MPGMTDPSDALKIFQDAMLAGPVELERGQVDPSVYMHLHRGHRIPQNTFVFLDGKTVRAFATFALNGIYKGSPNLAVGYAVPEAYRNKGLATAILRAGIAEMQNGFKGMPPFYVEAVVSEQNTASLKVAEAVLGEEIERINDDHTGEPAVRFARKFETGPSHTT